MRPWHRQLELAARARRGVDPRRAAVAGEPARRSTPRCRRGPRRPPRDRTRGRDRARTRPRSSSSHLEVHRDTSGAPECRAALSMPSRAAEQQRFQAHRSDSRAPAPPRSGRRTRASTTRGRVLERDPERASSSRARRSTPFARVVASQQPLPQLAFLQPGEAHDLARIVGAPLHERERLQHRVVQVRGHVGAFVGRGCGRAAPGRAPRVRRISPGRSRAARPVITTSAAETPARSADHEPELATQHDDPARHEHGTDRDARDTRRRRVPDEHDDGLRSRRRQPVERRPRTGSPARRRGSAASTASRRPAPAAASGHTIASPNQNPTARASRSSPSTTTPSAAAWTTSGARRGAGPRDSGGVRMSSHATPYNDDAEPAGERQTR